MSYYYCKREYDKSYFLCQGNSAVAQEKDLTRVEMKKDQLKFLPFNVIFRSQAIKKQMTNNSSDDERRMTGFTLNWFLEDNNGTYTLPPAQYQPTEKLPARQEDWKQEVSTPTYEQHLLAKMVRLARQLKLQKMKKKEILKEVIQNKSANIKILEEDGVCSMGQVKPQNQIEAFSKLASYESPNKTEGQPSDEDIKTGYELFQAIVYCPKMLIKFFRFVDQLLSVESSRTIIHTFVSLFQSGAITDKTSLTLAKQFYHVLASTLNLQYGNVLLANKHLQTVIRNDWPFFANNTELVEKCLHESKCEGTQGIIQKLGMFLDCV